MAGGFMDVPMCLRTTTPKAVTGGKSRVGAMLFLSCEAANARRRRMVHGSGEDGKARPCVVWMGARAKARRGC